MRLLTQDGEGANGILVKAEIVLRDDIGFG